MASICSSPLPTHSYASISKKTVTFSMGVTSVIMPRLSFVSVPSSHRRRTSSSKRSSNLRKIRSSTAPTAEILTADTAVVCNLSEKLKKVLVPIGFGTEEMEAVVLVDILRRAGAEVTVASVEPQLEVETLNGTTFVANTSIAKCSDQVFDLVALPGGMPGSVRLRDCEILQKITKKQAEEKRLYGAISTAPAITLLPWGLLRRKKTTGHPAFFDKLPTFWAVKSNIQVSGELTTSRGPGTSFQFALSLVEQLFGESVAKSIGEIMLMRDAHEHPSKEEFNNVDWSLDHNPHALIPVANGSEDIEAVIMTDILRRANVDVTIASVERSLKVVGSQGTKIVADKSIRDAAKSIYDLIILPGGITGAERLQKSKILKKLLKEQYAAARIYGAISSSSTVLQKQGFLKEKRTTAYPSVANEIPNEIVAGAEVVIDGNLITGLGLATISDFALAIISKLFGHGRARSVAEGLVVEYPRT